MTSPAKCPRCGGTEGHIIPDCLYMPPPPYSPAPREAASPALLTKEQVAKDPYGLMKLRRAYELSQNRTGMVVGLPHVNIESSQVNHALVYIDKLREHITALEQRVEATNKAVREGICAAFNGDFERADKILTEYWPDRPPMPEIRSMPLLDLLKDAKEPR